MSEKKPGYGGKNVDPEVMRALAQEPVEVQRAVVGLLNILKTMSKKLTKNR